MNARLEDVQIDDLAPRLRELVTVVGLPAAARLIQRRGGTRINVPANAEGSVIADIMGVDAAERMITHYGPGEILLDKGRRALKAIEDREIARLWQSGGEENTAPKLAIRFDRTERAIYKVLERAGKLKSPQQDLYR